MNRKPVIAVVDDDPAVLQALSRLIRAHGGAALPFSSAPDFLSYVATTTPDLLILDVQMPGMTGIDLYAKLLAQGRKFPVLFITAHEDPQAEKWALDHGAAAFLHKPFQGVGLWAAIHVALHPPPAPSQTDPHSGEPPVHHRDR